MVVAVADTHAALWYLFNDVRLSVRAGEMIDQAVADRRKIAVSSISLAELVYLVEKRRLSASAFDDLSRSLADPEHVFVEAPFSADVAAAMRMVSRDEVPDLPDRIVAATGVYLSVPMISRDRMIRAANLRTIW